MCRGEADLMDADGFLAALPGLFDDFPSSDRPGGRRFDDIIATVPNLSTENNLALLNLAASLLGPGESYIEVGSFLGASLIGAMRGNEDRDFVALDRFESATQPFSSSGSRVSRKAFEANLARFGATGATVIEGDAFEILESAQLEHLKVGVFFWDADHTQAGQLRGLRDIEPRLAPGALLIIDNADRPDVTAGVDAWLLEQPRARLALQLAGSSHGQPWWHDGIHILRWEG
jgi:predicted O-methyltransferase YrrM